MRLYEGAKGWYEGARGRVNNKALALSSSLYGVSSLLSLAAPVPIAYWIYETCKSHDINLGLVAIGTLGTLAVAGAVLDGIALSKKKMSANMWTNIFHISMENPITAATTASLFNVAVGPLQNPLVWLAGSASIVTQDQEILLATLAAQTVSSSVLSTIGNAVVLADKTESFVSGVASVKKKVFSILQKPLH